MEKFHNVFCFNHIDKDMACYCPECIEALCSECACYHTLHLKHRPVPNVFMQFMPAFLLEKINRCSRHNEKPEYFTSNHGNPCCKTYYKQVHTECRKYTRHHGGLPDLKLAGKLMFQVKAGDITGCKFLPNNQMVFVDNKYDTLIIHDSDGSLNRCIDLLCKPYDIVYITDEKLAITQASEIIIFDIETDLTMKWIDIGSPCFGVSYYKDLLMVCLGDGQGIQYLDQDGDVQRECPALSHGVVSACCYDNNIYVVDNVNNSVYCSDSSNKITWSYTEKWLKGASQIAVDERGYLYVVYEKSLKVLVISPNGKRSKILLCEQDGLHFPKAISCRNGQLLVCNSTSCTALIYNIVYSEKQNHRFMNLTTSVVVLFVAVVIAFVIFYYIRFFKNF